MQKSLAFTRALVPLVAVLVAVGFLAGCSSSGDDDAVEVDPTPTASTAEPTPSPSAGSDAGQGSEEAIEVPTIDVEAALEGIDTETPPDPQFCEMSAYLNSEEWNTDFNTAIAGGDEGHAVIEQIAQHFEDMEAIAPDDLKQDVALVGSTLTNYLEVVAEAVDNDDFVDATELQEQFAEIADSGARLGAYDQVVCGNVAPGEGEL